MEIVTPSGTDETSQRADALTVTSKKPFFVVDAIGQPVFAAAVAQSKTIVNSNTGTPDDWNKQAPYRWASVDADGTPVQRRRVRQEVTRRQARAVRR